MTAVSLAWEVTEDDILIVLHRHGLTNDPTIVARCEELMMDHAGEVEDAALWYDDMDDQTAAAFAKIEQILIDNDVISEPNLFTAPDNAH